MIVSLQSRAAILGDVLSHSRRRNIVASPNSLLPDVDLLCFRDMNRNMIRKMKKGEEMTVDARRPEGMRKEKGRCGI